MKLVNSTMRSFLLPFSSRCLVSPSLSILSAQRYICRMTVISNTQCRKRPDTFMMSKRNAITFPNILAKSKTSNQLKLNASLIYESIADTIDYNKFFQEFQMEDTFFSWFLVTEIHVWMMALRIMQEEENGPVLRNHVIQAMWDDVKIRSKKLGVANASILNKQLGLLSEQFNASLVGYDEAILSTDALLANHLWKRFFKCEKDDPKQLERLVEYIRKNVNLLSNTPTRDIFDYPPSISWIKF